MVNYADPETIYNTSKKKKMMNSKMSHQVLLETFFASRAKIHHFITFVTKSMHYRKYIDHKTKYEDTGDKIKNN